VGGAIVNPAAAPVLDTNPFVGPRSFEASDRLHGRDREIRELVDVLVAERVVVLHSPSGAGKTSLLRAGVLPRLQEDGFAVLPVVRLTHELPPDLAPPGGPPPNTYVLNTLLSLEGDRPAERQRSAAELAGLSIGQYLAARRAEHGVTEVLVFDQFEEVITADPTDLAAKAEFFTQLGAALRDRGRWALFALREDFLAELDPYTALVPTRLANRFRLDLLSVDAALLAVTRPAHDAGVLFEPLAAARLVDDLRRVRVQRPGGPVDALGPHVEPVQLQVVCRRLWERLPPGARTVERDDLHAVGDVDQSLAGYYADSVAAAARWAGVRERALRDWFERALVTAQGFRGQAVDGPLGTEPQDRSVLGHLTSVHLLRAESRRGATWYELAHDRLVAPVLADNARWRVANLSDFEQRALWWDEQGRPDQLLLTGDQLATPAVDEPERSPLERDYLAASLRARELAERERRANRRTRRWLVVALVGLALAVLSCAVAVRYWITAADKGRIATRALLVQQGTQWLPTDGDLGLLLGLRAATVDGQRDASDPQVQSFLQNAVDTLPVVQVLREDGAATAVAYSPDGRFVLTGHADGSVLVRDGATGAPVRTVTAAGPVRAVDIGPGAGPEQAAVAAAGAGGVVQVWLPGRAEAVSLPVRPSDVLSVQISPDGAAVAAAGADGTVVVADVATGAVRRELRRAGAATPINDIGWTPDGSRLVAADDEGVVAIWDVGTGELLREIRGHPKAATSVAVLGSRVLGSRALGSRVLSGGADGAAVMWDVGTGAEIFRVPGAWPVADVSASPDGGRLLIVDVAGNALVVDGTSGRVLRSVSGHGARPLAAQLDPAAPDRAVVATRVGAAAIWDVAAGHPRYPGALATAPDGTTVTAAGDDPTVRVWSADGRERGAVPIGAAGVGDVALSADGQRLAVVDSAGTASVRPLRGSGPAPSSPALSLPATGVTALTISPDGRLLATGSGPVVTVWNADDGAQVRTLEPAGAAVDGLAFSPAADQLVGTAADGTATVWGLDDGRARHTLTLDGAARAVAWSPAGDTIATAGAGLTIQLWDPRTGQSIRTLPGHRDPVNDIAFDGTGARLASAGQDGEVDVWNVADGSVQVRRQYPTWVYRVAFAPDGRHLIITNQRPTPLVVYLDGDELLAAAQARPTRALSAAECARFVVPYTDCGAGE
jgi:WD40 repeat protein